MGKPPIQSCLVRAAKDQPEEIRALLCEAAGVIDDYERIADHRGKFVPSLLEERAAIPGECPQEEDPAGEDPKAN